MGVVGLIAFLLLGILLGIATGMIPGLHVNNIAVIALYFYSLLGINPTALAVMLIGNMITHTFVDFIPSTFFGAPAEDTALSTLPMHRMLLQGRGFQAIYLSTYGSIMAVLLSLPLIPVFFLLLSHLSFQLFYWTPVILLSITLAMLYMEGEKGLRYVAMASGVFLLSGFLGLIVFNLPTNGNFVPLKIISGGSLLFPVFSGLFGIPVLLMSRDEPIPEQSTEAKVPERYAMPSFLGTLAGALVGLLPGVSSGVATIMARLASRRDDLEGFIVSMGSVNTSNYIFNLLALFVILKPRSGAVAAIGEIVSVESWISPLHPPSTFILFLIVVVAAGAISFPLTIHLAKKMALWAPKMSRRYRRISFYIIAFILLLVFLFSGPLGLAILALGTLIGLLPQKLGVMRVHMMGVIILPVLLLYLGL